VVSTDCAARRCNFTACTSRHRHSNYDVITSPAFGGGMHCLSASSIYCINVGANRIVVAHNCKSRIRSVYPLPSNRHHWSSGDCLEGKGESYQVCSVQYCVQQLCTVRCTHMNRPTVLWIGFYLTGPISLCLDSFLHCVLLCVVCMRRFVTW